MSLFVVHDLREECDDTQVEGDEGVQVEVDEELQALVVNELVGEEADCSAEAMHQDKKDEVQGQAVEKQDEVQLPAEATQPEQKDESQGQVVEGEKKDEAKKLSPKRKSWWPPANFNWMQQCSKHLHHIEGRLMESEFVAHETIRQLQQLFRAWSPHQGGTGLGFGGGLRISP